MKGVGYAIWFMPGGEIYKKYKQIISQLSKKHSAPAFEPHITLISRLIDSKEDVLLKTANLSKTIRPFEINLTKAFYLDEYFRCVFVLTEKTKPLMDANQRAREIFGVNGPYMLHLSLLYGHFDEKTKKKIIEELGDVSSSFEVKSLYVYSTDGEVEKWFKIKEFSLH